MSEISAKSGSSLTTRAVDVAKKCQRIGRHLALRAERAKQLKALVRGINVVVGIAAVAVTFIEPIATAIGPDHLKYVGIVAAVVLIFDGVVPIVFGEFTPDRFRDYSVYILHYADRLHDTLADDGLPDSERRARVLAIIDLATKNLADVTSQWPDIK